MKGGVDKPADILFYCLRTLFTIHIYNVCWTNPVPILFLFVSPTPLSLWKFFNGTLSGALKNYTSVCLPLCQTSDIILLWYKILCLNIANIPPNRSYFLWYQINSQRNKEVFSTLKKYNIHEAPSMTSWLPKMVFLRHLEINGNTWKSIGNKK